MEFFQRVFGFIRAYPGILYSLVLLVVVPLALYYNTFLAVNSFQKNVDLEIQTKALLLEDIFSAFAADFFAEPEFLQQKIKEITEHNPEITNLRVLSEAEKGNFEVIASQDSQELGIVISTPSLALSWSQNQTIANLISEKGERFWKVIKPVYNKKNGEKIGLVSLELSLKQSDALITQSIYRSYLIVVITIVLSLFLIIQHTHLFGYVALSKRLQELDKMKDNFIRMATHELQTPIANIRGYVSVLEDEISHLLNKTQKEYFRRVSISAKNLSSLISDILEVSRIEQGRLDFSPQKIEPVQLVKEVLSELQLKAEQKNLRLILVREKEEKEFFILVNPNRFRQLLVNLVENAIKYTLGGEIRVEVKRQENKCFISVKDTGLGIPAEAQQRLFERFYRVRTRETADISGTGLGLWISKQLCEKMGGKIFVESMEGVGSKFTIVFPITKS